MKAFLPSAILPPLSRRDFLASVGALGAVSCVPAGQTRVPQATRDTALGGSLSAVPVTTVRHAAYASTLFSQAAKDLLVTAPPQAGSDGVNENGLVEVTSAGQAQLTNYLLTEDGHFLGPAVLAGSDVFVPSNSFSPIPSALVRLTPGTNAMQVDMGPGRGNLLFSGLLVVCGKLFVTVSEFDSDDLVAGPGWVESVSPDSLIGNGLVELSGQNPTGLAARPNGEVVVLTSGNERSLQSALHIFHPDRTESIFYPDRTESVRTIDLPSGVMAQVSGKLTLSEDGRYAYVGTVDEFGKRSGELFKVNLETGEVVTKNLLPQGFHDLHLSGAVLYIVDYNNGGVFALDADTLDEVDYLPFDDRLVTAAPLGDGALRLLAGETLYDVRLA